MTNTMPLTFEEIRIKLSSTSFDVQTEILESLYSSTNRNDIFPYDLEKILDLVIKAIELSQTERVVILGDTLDISIAFTDISHKIRSFKNEVYKYFHPSNKCSILWRTVN